MRVALVIGLALCAVQAIAGEPFTMPLGAPNPDPHPENLPFSVDPRDLGHVEAGYTCPENLPTPADRMREIADFTISMRRDAPSVTLGEFAAERYKFLARHHCVVTLRHIRENARQ